ncbi:hypothetical protein [Trueperella pecoris]|uniref:hypothetical protein n=1 Tax=Trueperella pecoris TaxID=2733571 RepID=UPI001ABE0128|nr:hypothetical protein [Trueperella pecoris]QTG75959.1 hypothetical protein J4179_02555 [Trueperella pecoris]
MRKQVATLAAIALLTSACASEGTLPRPASGTNPQVILTQEKFAEIAAAAEKDIAAANSSLDAAALGNRVGGPVRAYRTSQLKLESLLGESYNLDPLIVDGQATPVSSGTAFPRTLMTVVPPREGKNLTTLSVWSQDQARSNYQLWADVALFPGVEVPAIVSSLNNSEGFPKVDPAAYAVNPEEVLANYVAYNGTRQPQKIRFQENDPLFRQIADQQDAFVRSLGNLGTATTDFAAGEAGLRGVSTENGGLVIVGEMRYTVRITKTAAGAKLRIGGQIGALHKDSGENPVLEIDKQGVANYSTTVVFYIPGAGSDATVRVIGSSEPTLISVENVAQ